LQFRIDKKNFPIRLDQYLAKKLPTRSRSFLKSRIKAGNVLVNGKITKPSYILKENDEIELEIAEPKQTILKPNSNIKLNIIYEDKDIIAIDKPAGLTVHPTKKHEQNTLVNALLAYYPPLKGVGDEPELRPGIVHRLDKDTSGLMVIAKNNEAFHWLKKQFSERKVEKKYTALVIGKLKAKEGIISKALSRAKGSIKWTIVPRIDVKEAITYYRVLEIFPSLCHPKPQAKDLMKSKKILRSAQNNRLFYTLLEAQPKTGRTHQIRVHLASIGHPIAGDKLYCFKRQEPPEGLKRQFLHASYLKLSLLDGKIVELRSELPEDLKEIINALSQATDSKSKFQNPNDK